MQDGSNRAVIDSIIELGFSQIENSEKFLLPEATIQKINNSVSNIQQDQENAARTVASAFRIASWTLSFAPNNQLRSDLRVSINTEDIISCLQMHCNNVLTNLERSHFIPTANGEIWCLFEFHKPEKKVDLIDLGEEYLGPNVRVGLAGLKMQIQAANRMARIVTSDHFSIGFVPNGFLIQSTRFIADAIGMNIRPDFGPIAELPTIFELPFRIESAALPLCIFHRSGDPKVTGGGLAFAKALAHEAVSMTPTIEFRDGTWHLYSFSHVFSEGSRKPKLALEVLEARESRTIFPDVDQLLLAGEYLSAEERCRTFLASHPRSLYLLRRIALLGLSGIDSPAAVLVMLGREREPNHKVFICHQLAIAILERRYSLTLEQISILGECLMADGLSIEGESIFDLAFPELLGDAWQDMDKEMAIACYERVLQKRGEIPRILRKLIQQHRARGEKDEEIALLDRLAQVGPSDHEASLIFLSRAELAEATKGGEEHAIDLSLKSLQFNRSQYRAAILAAELMRRTSRYEAAIELLGDIVQDHALSIPDSARSAMEERIGAIWLDDLSRPDLAVARFESSLRFSGANMTAYQRLEEVFVSEGRQAELVQLLLRKFKWLEASANGNDLTQNFVRLVEVCQGQPNELEIIPAILQRVLAVADPLAKATHSLLNFDYEIDWNIIARRLQEALASRKDDPNRSGGFCALADILKTKFNAYEEAIACLYSAIELGPISPTHFSILIDALRTNGNIEQLVFCFKKQVAYAAPLERRELLGQILNYEGFLDTREIDSFILELYSPAHEDQERLLRRLNFYARKGDLVSVKSLFDALFEKRIGITYQIKWIKYWNEILNDPGKQGNLSQLDRNFRRLLAIGDDEIAVYREAIAVLKGFESANLLIFYLSGILRKGFLPDLDHEIVLGVLADHPGELARYYELRAYHADANVQAAAWARSAYSLLELIPGTELRREQMLAKMSISIHVTESALESLKALVTKTNHWHLYADALREQIGFAKNVSESDNLKTELAFVYRYRTKEPGLARAVYESLLRTTDDVSYVLLQLAEIGGEIHDEHLVVESLREILENQNPFTDLDQYCIAISRLYAISRDAIYLSNTVQRHIDEAVLQRDYRVSGELAHTLLEIGVSEPGLWLAKFKSLVVSDKQADLAACWLNGMRLIKTGEAMQAFVDETRRFLVARDRQGEFLTVLGYASDSEVIKEMDWEARNEFLISYAFALFDQKSTQEHSLESFLRYHEYCPDDQRVWVPIYFLLREFGSHMERQHYLERILPSLKLDASVLQRYPVTLELLEKELITLRLEIGSRAVGNAQVGSQNPDNLAYPAIPRLDEVTPIISEQHVLLDSGADVSRSSTRPQRGDSGLSKSAAEVAIAAKASGTSSGLLAYADVSVRYPFVANEVTQDSTSILAAGDKEARLREVLSIQPQETRSEHPEIDIEDLSDDEDLKRFDHAQVDITKTDLGYVVPFRESAVIRQGRHQEEEVSLNIDGREVSEEYPVSSEGKEPVDLVNEIEVDLELGNVAADESLLRKAEEVSPLDTTNTDHFELEAKETDHEQSTDEESNSDAGIIASGQDSIVLNSQVPTEATVAAVESAKDDSPGEILKDDRHQINLLADNSPGKEVSPYKDSAVNMIRRNFRGSWRDVVKARKVNIANINEILEGEFDHDLEQHLTLQIVAVHNGDIKPLQGWKWNSWRSIGNCNYRMTSLGRIPNDEVGHLTHSPLFKLIQALVPVMIKVFNFKYTTDGFMARLKLSPEKFTERIKEISIEEGVLRRSGVHIFQGYFKSQQQRIFAFEGLGSYIYYDAVKRFFYLDPAHYNSAPPSHLFHRLLGIQGALKLQYFAPLQLDARQEMMGLISEVERAIFSSGTDKIKRILGIGSGTVERVLRSANLDALKQLFKDAGPINESMIAKLWAEMNLEILKIQLADTVDLIGIFESICDRDLVAKGFQFRELVKGSSYIEPLIEFSSKLIFADQVKGAQSKESA